MKLDGREAMKDEKVRILTIVFLCIAVGFGAGYSIGAYQQRVEWTRRLSDARSESEAKLAEATSRYTTAEQSVAEQSERVASGLRGLQDELGKSISNHASAIDLVEIVRYYTGVIEGSVEDWYGSDNRGNGADDSGTPSGGN
jgi:uncharacterized protein HemX